jgi:hypothetical protein
MKARGGRPSFASRSSVRSTGAGDGTIVWRVTNTHMECGLSSGRGCSPRCVRGSVRRGERIGCRRRLCRDSYARVGGGMTGCAG